MVGTRSQKGAENNVACEVLKQARLRAAKTVDEIAAALRIPPKYLRSLEEGELSVFSAEVYAKGAYVKYAKYLGVFTRNRYCDFLRALSEVRELVPLTLPIPATWLSRMITPVTVWVAGLSMVVVAMGLYIGWEVSSFMGLPKLELLNPEGAVVESAQVMVRGKAQKDAHVVVNSEDVLLDEEGVFEIELPLRQGVNVVRVEAMGASGRVNVVEKELLVPSG
jgi:hypothetical protein